jgi:hypothetical protein
MAAEDTNNQHVTWSQKNEGSPELLSSENRMYLFAAFFLVSFGLLGYILLLKKNAEKEEIKKK